MSLWFLLLLALKPTLGSVIGTLTDLRSVLHDQPCDSSVSFVHLDGLENAPVVVTERGSVLHLLGVPEEVLNQYRCQQVMVIGNFYIDALTIEVQRLRVHREGKWRKVWERTTSTKTPTAPTPEPVAPEASP